MMVEQLAANLILTLIFGPLLCGGLCLAAKPRYTQFIFYIHFAIHVICLLTLPFVGDIVFPESVDFFGHPITISVSTTSTAIFLITVTALFLMLLVSTNPEEIAVTRYQAVIIEVALSTASVAFFSGQFMIRYIALEFVGLMIAVAVLHPWDSDFQTFTDIFFRLRFGDLCLLASILLLSSRAGTLDIALMIETATQLPLPDQALILAGFLLAVLVKLAVFPFDGWWVRFAQETPSLKYWIGTILMPALGHYLLIRIAPIMHAHPVLQYGTAVAAVLLMAIAYLSPKMKGRDFYQQANSFLGCFTVLFAAFLPYVSLRVYIIAVLGFRVFSVLQPQLPFHTAKPITRILLVVINSFVLVFLSAETPIIFIILWALLTLIFLFWAFHHSTVPQQFPDMQQSGVWKANQAVSTWLYQKVEVGSLSHLVSAAASGFTRISEWVYLHIETGFDQLWLKSSEVLMVVSLSTLQSEEKEQRQIHQRIRSWLTRLEQFEVKRKSTPAHWDLIWIPFILFFILIFLFLT